MYLGPTYDEVNKLDNKLEEEENPLVATDDTAEDVSKLVTALLDEELLVDTMPADDKDKLLDVPMVETPEVKVDLPSVPVV